MTRDLTELVLVRGEEAQSKMKRHSTGAREEDAAFLLHTTG